MYNAHYYVKIEKDKVEEVDNSTTENTEEAKTERQLRKEGQSEQVSNKGR
ncbi:MAG: hypothetical protein R3B60_02245 [Candidatus Paceibacterota bacterium]